MLPPKSQETACGAVAKPWKFEAATPFSQWNVLWFVIVFLVLFGIILALRR